MKTVFQIRSVNAAHMEAHAWTGDAAGWYQKEVDGALGAFLSSPMWSLSQATSKPLYLMTFNIYYFEVCVCERMPYVCVCLCKTNVSKVLNPLELE